MMSQLTRLKRLLALLLLISPTTAWAETDWAKVRCPSNQVLARELIELQVSGHRVPGAKASCLNQSKFKYTRVLELTTGEGSGGAKVSWADESKPYEIKRLRELDDGNIEVQFVYNVRSKGKTQVLEDSLVFTRYEGYGKPLFGCASAVLEPRHLVVRPSCYKQ